MSWRSRANLNWLAGLEGVQPDHPLAKNTTFNIGGPAEWFVEVFGAEQQERLLLECHRRQVPYFLLGAGTNLLIADAGIEGLVIRCTSRESRFDGNRVHAAAGLKMMRLARLAADRDLVGLEFAIGVPGTIGGAVYQNAGCWGRELSEVLISAEGYRPGTGRETWPLARLGLGYRTSLLREGDLHGSLITGAWFQLAEGDGAAAKVEMKRLTAERRISQPIDSRNCGSVFKNPPGDSAGRLVEAAGMKGAWEGRAQVSDLHANFILNQGGASAADVARLIGRVQAAVRERFAIELEPEVELVGSWEGGR